MDTPRRSSEKKFVRTVTNKGKSETPKDDDDDFEIPFKRLLIIVVLVGGLLALMARGYMSFVDYVDNDPAFCADCHVEQTQYALWASSDHRTVACQQCHRQTREEAVNTLRRFVFEAEVGDNVKLHSPKVPDSSCGHCHLHNDSNWPEISGSVGHEVHVEQQKISCMSCHARAIHKFGAALDSCADCHESQVIQATGMEDLHCMACHNFISREGSLKPHREDCMECHHSEGVGVAQFPTNAPMANLECWSCHHPHKGSETALSSCRPCHDQVGQSGLHEIHNNAVCTNCHSAHAWVAGPESCTNCHSEIHEERGECWSCHTPK